MKLFGKTIKLPKTVTGIAITLVGAGVSFIPYVGPVAAPYIMSAGAGMITIGGAAKAIRAVKGGDPLEHEKQAIKAIKSKTKE